MRKPEGPEFALCERLRLCLAGLENNRFEKHRRKDVTVAEVVPYLPLSGGPMHTTSSRDFPLNGRT